MRTILITGGSRGIGRAIAESAADKFNIAFTYNKNAEAAQNIVSALSGKCNIAAFQCDISDVNSVKTMVSAVYAKFRHIDVLVNSAGIAEDCLFQDITDEMWHKLFSVNVDGAFYLTREVAPHMIADGGGKIINISSMWGEVGASMESCYSSTKAALIGLTRALAKELAPSNITVNAVAPGAIDTDMMADYTPTELAELISRIPLGRMGKPCEIADAVMYLASANYVTGHVLDVNGGLVI